MRGTGEGCGARTWNALRCGGLAILALHLSGCATVIPMSVAPTAEDPGVRYLEEEAQSRAGWVYAADSSFIASRLRVDRARGELLFHRFPGDSASVPLSQVQVIDFPDFARGTLEGIGGGLGLAAAVGLLTAALSDGSGERSRAEQGLHVGGITAVFTVPLGFIIGLGGGHSTYIQVGAGGGG